MGNESAHLGMEIKKTQNGFTEDGSIPDGAQTCTGVTLIAANYEGGEFEIFLRYLSVRNKRANRLRNKRNSHYTQN